MTDKSATNARARRWAFTWNNYTENDVNRLRELPNTSIDYLIFGFEKAPDTGTPHLQGYLEMPRANDTDLDEKMMDPEHGKTSPVHLSPAEKVREANILYCQKVIQKMMMQ